MTPYELAQRHMTPYKTRGSEITPKLCPYCGGGQSKDKYTFALNGETGAFNCKRGECGKQGNFAQLCKHLGEMPGDGYRMAKRTPRQYTMPKTQIQPVTTAAERYLAQRKISKATLDAYGVGCDEQGNIVFPFTRGGSLVFVKFRPSCKVAKGQRKAWREEGTRPILFGMDLCDTEYPLVITEGEIDTLSLYESGIRNAVSVPSGAGDLTWLDECWDWLEAYGQIVICGDEDEPGKEMARTLASRLGEWRCRIVTLPEGCKDANETLYRHGTAALKTAVESAKSIPVHGLRELADVQRMDIRTVERISSGIPYLDRFIGGWRMGEVTIITGKGGEGKSTLAGQLMLEAIDQGYSVCAYSGELPAEVFQYWIDLQAAGKQNIDVFHDELRESDRGHVNAEVAKEIHDWYRGRFFLYDNNISNEGADSLMNVFTAAFRRYGCKMFFVDNLIIAGYTMGGDDYLRAQGKITNTLRAFAKKYHVHVIMVAHPRKKKNNEETFDNDDVAGLAEITYLCDNVLNIKRGEDTTLLTIGKSRMDGKPTAKGELRYCPISKRLYAESVGANREYGWAKPDWQKLMDEKLGALM